MAEDALLAKRNGGLFPTDVVSDEVIGKIPQGVVVKCEIVRPRNERHHRLAMALLKKVFSTVQDFDTFPTFKIFYDHLKVNVGCCDWYTAPDGTRYAIPRSWAWHMMDQAEFQENWDVVMKYVTTVYLPGVDNAVLEQEVYEMLGGPTPQDIRR